MKYVYPAVFVPESDKGYSIYFPDIPMGATQGECLVESMDAAEKFLGDALCFIEDEKREIPKPSATVDLEINDGDVVTLVSVDTMEYRKKHENKAVKKTLTIPSWLNVAAEAADINFSQILQKALKEELQISE
ncbi:MAG: type II toxin-antitoxin system HicB family antitoxin [Defluviitaleaceae bacterium]|nr:type II toxin-antitoxin system HicB family antitoxin [Defluviitaleaceae bacterium]